MRKYAPSLKQTNKKSTVKIPQPEFLEARKVTDPHGTIRRDRNYRFKNETHG